MIEIHTDIDNGYRFSLKTESGHCILNSEKFLNISQIDKVVLKLSSTPLTRDHFERKTNTEGKFLFSLKDDAGFIIGHSNPYDSEAGMENGIKNLRENIKSLL